MAVFTPNQTTASFTNSPQVAPPNNIRARLALEGIVNVDNFDGFKEDQINQAFKNMRTAIPGILYAAAAGGAAAVPVVAAVPPVLVSAKCDLCLKVALIAYHYYDSIGRAVTPSNINYTNFFKGFNIEYGALVILYKGINPAVPLLSTNQTPLKWIESFKDCIFCTYSIHQCPLLYVVLEDDAVPNEAGDTLVARYSYGDSVSVLDDLIAPLDNTDLLYKSDNAMVYSLL